MLAAPTNRADTAAWLQRLADHRAEIEQSPAYLDGPLVTHNTVREGLKVGIVANVRELARAEIASPRHQGKNSTRTSSSFTTTRSGWKSCPEPH